MYKLKNIFSSEHQELACGDHSQEQDSNRRLHQAHQDPGLKDGDKCG